MSGPPLYRLVRAVIRPVLKIWCGLQHPARETIPGEGPLLIVANHRSYLDAFLLAAAFPRPIAFLATSEAFRPVHQRIFLNALGCIRLRRFAPDPSAIRRALSTLEAGGVVGIFPEGERSWDGGPSPILNGVPRLIELADVPVVPIAIHGSYRLWPRWGRGPRRAHVRVHWSGPERPPRGRDPALWLVQELATHPARATSRRRSASDVGRLIWRCPTCRRPDAVRGHADGQVWCLRCGGTGVLWDGVQLSWQGSPPEPLRTWARRVALDGAERQRLLPPGPEAEPHWHYLRLSDGEKDRPLTSRGKGEAVLKPGALVLRARGWRACIPAGSVRAVTEEGSHKLQVATTRRIYEMRYRRGSPRGPRAYLEAWLDARGITYRRG